MECPKCGKQILDNLTVCPECKKVIALKCPNCNALSEEPVCSKCGYSILVKCSKCSKISPVEKGTCPKCGFPLKTSLAYQECESDEFASIIVKFDSLPKIKSCLKSKELYSKFLYKIKNLLLSNLKGVDSKLVIYDDVYVINMNKELSFTTSANKALRLSLKIINSFVELNLKITNEFGINLGLNITILKKEAEQLLELVSFNNNVKVLALKNGVKKYLKGLQVTLDQYVWDEVHKEYKTDSLYSLEENGHQLMLYEVVLDSYVLPPEEKIDEDLPQATLKEYKEDVEDISLHTFNNFDIKAKCNFETVTVPALLDKINNINLEEGGKIISIVGNAQQMLPTSNLINDLEKRGFNVLKVNCTQHLNFKPWGVFTEIFKENFSLPYLNKGCAISEVDTEVIKQNRSLFDLLYFKAVTSSSSEDARFAYMELWTKFISKLTNTIILFEGLEFLDDTSLQVLDLYFDSCKKILPNFIFLCQDESFKLHFKIKKLRQVGFYTEYILKKSTIEDCLAFIKSDATEFIQSFYYEKIKSNFKGSSLYFENAVSYLREAGALIDFENKFLLKSEKSVVLPKNINDLIKARLKNLSKNQDISLILAYLGLLGGRIDVKTFKQLNVKDVEKNAEILAETGLISYKNGIIFLNNYSVISQVIISLLKKEANDFLAKNILSNLAQNLDDSTIALFMGNISAYKEEYLTLWKNCQFAINTGDYDAYLKNSLKSLQLIEKIPMDIEPEVIEDNKKNLYNNILMFLYAYAPQKIYDIGKILLIEAIETSNDDRIVKLSNLMLQGALISSNYTLALDLLHNILTRLPNPTMLVNGVLNNKFLILSIIKIEILYNLGDFRQCSEIMDDILSVLQPETLEKIKPKNFSLESFTSHLLDTCRLVGFAKLLMLDDLDEFFIKIETSLGLDLPEKDCIIALRDYFQNKIYDTGNIEEASVYSKIIYLILQEVSTLEADYSKFAQNIYQAKLLALDTCQKELELICDLLIGFAYSKIGVLEKAKKIYDNVLEEAERLVISNVVILAKYLKVLLLIDKSQKEDALVIISSVFASLQKYSNNSKIFYVLFEKIYIDIIKDGKMIPCDIEIEEKKLEPYKETLKLLLM